MEAMGKKKQNFLKQFHKHWGWGGQPNFLSYDNDNEDDEYDRG